MRGAFLVKQFHVELIQSSTMASVRATARAFFSDNRHMHISFPRARRPKDAQLFLSPKTEGAGKAGCALPPAVRVQDAQECAHEHTQVQSEAIRLLPRNGFNTRFLGSPLVTGPFLPPSAARIFPRNFTPRPGRQTTLPPSHPPRSSSVPSASTTALTQLRRRSLAAPLSG